MINGVHAQNNRVADFFQSVGMNINNPHFLIMQVKISKSVIFLLNLTVGSRDESHEHEADGNPVNDRRGDWH
jgi:hypothetical protein